VEVQEQGASSREQGSKQEGDAGELSVPLPLDGGGIRGGGLFPLNTTALGSRGNSKNGNLRYRHLWKRKLEG
jgi:hypothetical protein